LRTSFLERGGNFVDTANFYTKGHSEKIIGDFIAQDRARRERMVLATKFFGNLYPGDPNGGGAGRKVGLYPNGQPGEMFIRMAKEGSTIAGLMECFGTVVSVSLQHGVPLKVLCDKLSHTRFEPSGWTGNEELGYAKSIMDYLFRWMELRFLSGKQLPLFTQQMAVAERQGSEEANHAPASVSQYTFTTAMRLAMRRSVSRVGH